MNIIRIGGIVAGGNTILVTTDSGATVYAVSGGKVVSGIAVGGVAKLKVKAGTWTVWAELDGQQTSEVEVIVTDTYYKEMSFGLPLSSLAEGALVKINENGSGVNFYLAKHDYESGLNGAGRSLVVRKDCHSVSAWNSAGVNTYANSTMDSLLNGTYKATLDSKVQDLIATTKFYYTPGNGNNTVTTLSRAVFCPSRTEFGLSTITYANDEGSALPIATQLVIGYFNGTATRQWTRTPWLNGTAYASLIESSGLSNSGTNVKNSNSPLSGDYYSRPCFTLPAKATVNPEPNADGSYTLIA